MVSFFYFLVSACCIIPLGCVSSSCLALMLFSATIQLAHRGRCGNGSVETITAKHGSNASRCSLVGQSLVQCLISHWHVCSRAAVVVARLLLVKVVVLVCKSAFA